MDKYEAYRVLNNLDSDIESDRDWKDIQYWIDALCDGEYLSLYDYSEEAVNSAVESLERLNHHTFMLFDLGVLVAEGSFAEVIDTLYEYPAITTSTLKIRIQGPYADDYIIRDATSSAALDALNILQLITFYQL